MHIKWLANASLEGRNFRNRFSFKKKHWKRKFFPPSKRDLILICSLASSTVANRISPLLILVSLDSCAPTPALFTSLDSDFLRSANCFLLHLLFSLPKPPPPPPPHLIPIAHSRRIVDGCAGDMAATGAGAPRDLHPPGGAHLPQLRPGPHLAAAPALQPVPRLQQLPNLHPGPRRGEPSFPPSGTSTSIARWLLPIATPSAKSRVFSDGTGDLKLVV
jgi:hypothetical protein